MAWERIGTVSKNGYTRDVAYDPASGKVDRQFGTSRDMSSSTPTSRVVPGRARSADEARGMAQRDLDSTFRKK